MLEFRKHLCYKAEEAFLSRDFGSNGTRATAKMLIYCSHLAKPLEIFSLCTCLRCQFIVSPSRPGFRTSINRRHGCFDLKLGYPWKSV